MLFAFFARSAPLMNPVSHQKFNALKLSKGVGKIQPLSTDHPSSPFEIVVGGVVSPSLELTT